MRNEKFRSKKSTEGKTKRDIKPHIAPYEATENLTLVC